MTEKDGAANDEYENFRLLRDWMMSAVHRWRQAGLHRRQRAGLQPNWLDSQLRALITWRRLKEQAGFDGDSVFTQLDGAPLDFKHA